MFVTSAQAHEINGSAVAHSVFDHTSPVMAQVAGGSDLLMSVLPFILIFVIMYFLILRPQRKQMKEREAMLSNIRRNDTVVTGGGIVGKVTKVIDDMELEIEIAKDTKIRTVRSLVADVRVKGDAVAARKKPAVTRKSAK